jgi:hypothetical protein
MKRESTITGDDWRRSLIASRQRRAEQTQRIKNFVTQQIAKTLKK